MQSSVCRLPSDQAREYGLLGKNIFGTGFNFDMELRLGAGAFVCGEETALMTSIEGKRGEPRPRPPFPAVKGLFDKPTILNNVETYANVPQIILNGPEWFASMGTEKIEGHQGIRAGRQDQQHRSGGSPDGHYAARDHLRNRRRHARTARSSRRRRPAVLPAAASLPSHLDVPIDYDNLIAIGSMMGSGGLIVMDEDTCMVDIAQVLPRVHRG